MVDTFGRDRRCYGMRAVALFVALLPVAATAGPPPASPVFDPLTFFAGRTEGQGSLRIMLSRARPIVVSGSGRVERDGSLTLDQTVIEGDHAPTVRRWTFRAIGPGRYTGTLSDAAGAVAGDVSGSRLHLRFRMHGGIVADQRLDLGVDGASAHNRMTFRKFGVIVARLNETIRRFERFASGIIVRGRFR